MMISYDEALSIVSTAAEARNNGETKAEKYVQLADALDHRANRDIRSPLDTPTFDSSAMDGYAVSSALTASASPAKTLHLRVDGTIAAGDPPLHLPSDIDEQGRVACVEIMTGASFPRSSLGPEFDACIPWEHTHALPSADGQVKIVKLTRAPKPNQHRRFAGHDFRTDDIVVAKGSQIGPHHIMAMASVGIDSVCIQRRPQATVITTGCELQKTGPLIPSVTTPKLADCNGPFLGASLRSLGIEVKSITGVSDDVHELQEQFRKAVANSNCDILITTGGVSAGKFDFVPETILSLGGSVHFHHVAIRPGHPVLFASLPNRVGGESEHEVPVFALPGNPIAAAACYRFLVVPYVRALLGYKTEEPMCFKKISPATCTLSNSSSAQQAIQDGSVVYQKDKKLDAFRHAQMCGNKVVLSSEQSPAKIRPFSYANCWVHVRNGISEVRVGDLVECYPLDSNTACSLSDEL